MVDEKSGCWNFSGQINMYGYGVISSKRERARTRYFAHRLSYEIHKGPIPKGLTIDHLCRNTRCVNPDHLEAVTNSENVRRLNAAIGNPHYRKNNKLSEPCAAPVTDTATSVVAARNPEEKEGLR